jgi:hypothetical protein
MQYHSKTKKKSALNSKYKPGDILLFRRGMSNGKFAYKIAFILEVWKVKAIRYRAIILQYWNNQGWCCPEIAEVTEYKLTHLWGKLWDEMDRDLRFLATHGSHISKIENIIRDEQFKKKIKKSLIKAKERVVVLEERLAAIERAEELLEARYERVNSESP